MKRFILFVLAFLLIDNAMSQSDWDFSAEAPTGQILYYKIDNTDTAVYVTFPSISEYHNSYVGYAKPTGSLIIPSSVVNNGTTYIVTSIGSSAFYGCTGLISVIIPNSVTGIGASAFYGCSGITTLGLSSNLTFIGSGAFQNCTNLAGNVTIPNSVTSIGYGAFKYCYGLTSVTIPNSVTSIGNEAFSNCTGLTSVTIPNSVTSICESTFSNCLNLISLTIPNSVTSIGNGAFEGCTGLTSVIFNADSCASAGGDYYNRAFLDCSNINTFSFGNTVKIIPSYLCAEMSNLTSVTIGDSVASIGDQAFSRCTGLTSVTIPNSVTSIGINAFEQCTGLTSVTIPNSVTGIGNGTFYGCTGLTSVTIPNSVTNIGNSAFSYCTGLTSVTIPNSVASIGDYAFYGCTGLTSVTIPNSVTSIGGNAFQDCDHITNISFGNGLQNIGTNAFKGCTQVVRIKSFATIAPTIESSTFSDLSDNVIVNVPCGYTSAYENAAYWHRFDIQEDLMYNFSATSRDPSRGTVQIINTPTCDNAEAEIQANPYHGYHFSRWSDGNTEAHRYLVVLQDTAIEAIFLAEGETEGIDDVNTDGINVWSAEGRIHVSLDGEPVKEFHVYDLMGREVFHAKHAPETPALPRGVYLVKVSTLPAKKVVVIR